MTVNYTSPGFPPESGILIEPLTVGLQAVYSNRPRHGETVLIIGGGVIGTMVLKAIRALEIDCCVAVADPSEFAGRQARQNGADHVITNGEILEAAVGLTGAARYKPMMGQDLLMGGFARIYDTVGSPKNPEYGHALPGSRRNAEPGRHLA